MEEKARRAGDVSRRLEARWTRAVWTSCTAKDSEITQARHPLRAREASATAITQSCSYVWRDYYTPGSVLNVFIYSKNLRKPR